MAIRENFTYTDMDVWLNEKHVTEIECLVPDLTGVARGKILPRGKFTQERGIPLLAICRGFQEVNVALGGTLHQSVHSVAGMSDHREHKGHTMEEQYAPIHHVLVEPDGVLARALDGVDRIMVNSLHGQGLDQLAPGLAVEARAADGLVEAYRVRDATGFTLAVQWHPEWKLMDNPDSLKLLQAFGDACRHYKKTRIK